MKLIKIFMCGVGVAIGYLIIYSIESSDQLTQLKEKEKALLKQQKDSCQTIDSLRRYIKAQRLTACILADKKYQYYSHGTVSSMTQFDGFVNYVYRYYPEEQMYCYCDSIPRDSL